ncbi:putative rhomboid protease [Microsporum audouinii]
MNSATWRTPCRRWVHAHSRSSSLLAQLRLLYPPSTRPLDAIRYASTKTPASSSSNNARRQPSGPKIRGHAAVFLERDLPAPQIAQIFGTATISAEQGNRILRALQEQRLSGTLDLPLPAEIARVAPPHIVDYGLAWLRRTHPLDEDAAILARIEREEQEEEEQLIRRAEELGLYKPQSGKFGTSTAREGDVYGSSILEEVRKKNMKESKETEEKRRQEWLDGEAKRTEELQAQARKFKDIQMYEPQELVEARPRADPTLRPALAWIQQQHLRATSTDADASNLTTARRLLPSLGVVALTVGLCYLYSETYEEPRREQRMWPDIKPAAATVVALVGLNLGVFVLWKFVPPAWRLLNKYFVSVPYYPHAASVIGSVFSHQQFRHLGSNMLILWFVGMRLHEEIGRGDFIAAYLSSGAFATFGSFAIRVLSNHLSVSSLGASGAISGIVAMWCVLHSK